MGLLGATHAVSTALFNQRWGSGPGGEDDDDDDDDDGGRVGLREG